MSLPCENCGKTTTYDGVYGGPACQHCGHKRPHSLLGSPLLPFLFYFGICLLIELFAPIPVPELLKGLLYMAGLVATIFLVCLFWKPRGPKRPDSPAGGENKKGPGN